MVKKTKKSILQISAFQLVLHKNNNLSRQGDKWNLYALIIYISDNLVYQTTL